MIASIPNPPSPTAKGVYPDPPAPVLISSINLPDRNDTSKSRFGGKWGSEYTNQVLTLHVQWVPMMRAVATPGMPASQSVTISLGCSVTSGSELDFGQSLGVTGDWGSIGATLNEKFTQSITFEASKTITRTLSIAPKHQEITGEWWQPLYIYTLKNTLTYYVNGQVVTKGPLTCVLENRSIDYFATQFPAPEKSEPFDECFSWEPPLQMIN